MARLRERLAAVADPAVTDSVSTNYLHEVFFGLTYALGTDFSAIEKKLRQQLAQLGFHVETIRLSAQFARIPAFTSALRPAKREHDLVEYLTTRMDAGDTARRIDPGILAKLAISDIAERRESLWRDEVTPNQRRGVAYILDSIMHPAEVDALRATYGNAFFLMAIHELEDERLLRLANSPGMVPSLERFKSEASPISNKILGEDEAARDERVKRVLALSLLNRNRGSAPDGSLPRRMPHQLALEDVFHLADVFFDSQDPSGPNTARRSSTEGLSSVTVEKFIALLFSEPFNTPSKSELGMSHAYVAALRSSSMSRRVGAAICARSGEILATGANEVPEPTGGEQWPIEENAKSVKTRDHETREGIDSNDELRHEIFRDMLVSLSMAGAEVVEPGHLLGINIASPDLPLDEVRARAAALASHLAAYQDVQHSRLFDITEFGRAVHAEMSAILSAGRFGIPVRDTTLYCTTLPCHECARHIIAAGIRRVVYVEPYPKSKAFDLHAGEIVLGGRNGVDDRRVEFFPYVGIAPGRLPELYSLLERRQRSPGQVARKKDWTLSSGLNLGLQSFLRMHLNARDSWKRGHIWKQRCRLKPNL